MYLYCRQVDQLLEAGANLLTAVTVGPQRQIGTAVDYAHHVYSQASTTANHESVNQSIRFFTVA